MTTDPRRILIARAIAVVADATQIGLFPLFLGGALSTANDALDVIVALAMVALVGWHWTFVPSFVAELVPGLDLAPTWTAAVFFATRKGGAAEAAPASPPPPALPEASRVEGGLERREKSGS